MEKLIITAAICGAEVTKAHNPAVPYTVEEMVREARSAFEAGAAVIHVHVRVGFEDNIYLEKGRKAASNGELVAKVVRLAKELGREVAAPDEARRLLSLA